MIGETVLSSRGPGSWPGAYEWDDESLLKSDHNWRITLDQIAESQSPSGLDVLDVFDGLSVNMLIPAGGFTTHVVSKPDRGLSARTRLARAKPALTPPDKGIHDLGLKVAAVPENESAPQADPLMALIEEAFADFVGMHELKATIHRQASLIKVQQLRESMGIVNAISPSRHMVFYGAPGTGKTTVARIIADIYCELGLLETDNVVEADQSMMIAKYLGQTATKTRELIESALGGVLFIDEAYSLTNRHWNDYGKEAIETLLKMMEDHRDNLVVIVAGYEVEMKEFLEANPGLLSRFSRHLTFPNYNDEELWQILQKICERNSYVIHDEESVKLMLLECFNDAIHSQGERFGNARYVRNLFERTIEMQALRLMVSGQRSLDDVTCLKLEDFVDGISEIAKQNLQ